MVVLSEEHKGENSFLVLAQRGFKAGSFHSTSIKVPLEPLRVHHEMVGGLMTLY